MTPATATFLDALHAAAGQAETAEGQYRREAAQRISALERERVFAYRRLNLMRALADAVAGSESEEVAVASAQAILRSKLGWSSDSEARTELLSRFAPVGLAVFNGLAASDEAPSAPVEETLAAFEAWYEGDRRTPFWILFEQYIPETPRVDF